MNSYKESLIRRLKFGGYSFAVIAAVLVILILVNLGIAALPTTYTTFSVSGQDIYGIADASREFVKKVEDPLTFYLVVNGEITSDTAQIVEKYTRRFAEISSHITVKTVDPTVYPNFLKEYTDTTPDSSVPHIVVKNEDNKRARFIAYDDIYYRLYSDYEFALLQQYYGNQVSNPTYFNLEGCLLSAVDYVTMEKLPTVYYTNTHGELAVDDTVLSLIDKENIALYALDLSQNEIPKDADVLLINAPSKDFTSDELLLLDAFKEKGGKVILTSYYNTSLEERELPNLYGFAAGYGLVYQDLLVMEDTSGSYYSAYGRDYIHPVVVAGSYADALPANTKMLLAVCHGIKIKEELPDTLTVSTLLTTTDKGFAKTEITENTKGEYEEGDPQGKFILGASSIDSEDSSRLVWFASPFILEGSTANSFSNLNYFMAVLSDLCQKKESITASAKALQVTALTVSDQAATVWGVVLIAVLPAAILGYGFFVWRRRCRR